MTMSDPIACKPGRFSSASAHYLAGRSAYAPALIRRVSEACGLRETHRVLDLGCGPGQLAIGFSYFAGEVVAADPEPGMLRAAEALAAGLAPNIRFMQGSSYDLGAHFGAFRLVTMGRSFHWMDREATLKTLDALIEKDGAIALFDDERPKTPANAWDEEFRAITTRYSADDPARSQRKGAEWEKHEAVLLRSAFCRLERIGVIERRKFAAERLIERALSMSSTSRDRLGARADELIAELKQLIAKVARDGMIEEVVESRATIARRAV
jgi:SAM-dependent methyltransferase